MLYSYVWINDGKLRKSHSKSLQKASLEMAQSNPMKLEEVHRRNTFKYNNQSTQVTEVGPKNICTLIRIFYEK